MEQKQMYLAGIFALVIIALLLMGYGISYKQKGKYIDVQGKEVDGNKIGNILLGVMAIPIVAAIFLGVKVKQMSNLSNAVLQSTFYYM